MLLEGKGHSPLALIKNKSYPTFQLYATACENEDIDYVFKTAIIETFAWLRQRFREFDKIPDEINLPDNFKDLQTESIRSFRIDEGYTIEVVYIQEEGIWAFQLIEPDLGVGDLRRAAVSGRIFQTNIGFKKTGTIVECGFQTICSEPETVDQNCEVFRPKIVKRLVEKLGLEQFFKIRFKQYTMNNRNAIDGFKELLNSEKRQIPLIAIMEYDEVNSKNEFDISTIKPSILNYKKDLNSVDFLATAPLIPKGGKEKRDKSINTELIANSLIGFAHTFVVPSTNAMIFDEVINKDYIKGKTVYIYYPKDINGKVKCEFYSDREIFKSKTLKNDEQKILTGSDAFVEVLTKKIIEHPKRNYDITFGNVMFIVDAHIEESKIRHSSKDSKEENEKLRACLCSAEKKLADKTQVERDGKIKKLEDEVLSLQQEKKEMQSKSKKIETELRNKIALQQEQFDIKSKEYEVKLSYPKSYNDIPLWVEKNFCGKIKMLSRATRDLGNAKFEKLDLVCEAIKLLANEYRNMRINADENDNSKELFDEKLNSLNLEFGKTANVQAKYACYDDYNPVYPEGSKTKRLLDKHLKYGVSMEKRYCMRIYFFYDKERDEVIVGYLPGHLPTR